MDDGSDSSSRAHDDPSFSYDLSHAVYGMLPSRATDISPRRSRASSPGAKTHLRRTNVLDSKSLYRRSISIGRNNPSPTWLPHPTKPRSLLQHGQTMDLHQSTCLNLNTASDSSTESDLWILPDFDGWEAESEREAPVASTGNGNEWAPLLRRAAKSNLERLRTRLEGDGWDFVGGRYGQDAKTLQEAASQGEESVDEEFDVVVLPAMRASS